MRFVCSSAVAFSASSSVVVVESFASRAERVLWVVARSRRSCASGVGAPSSCGTGELFPLDMLGCRVLADALREGEACSRGGGGGCVGFVAVRSASFVSTDY